MTKWSLANLNKPIQFPSLGKRLQRPSGKPSGKLPFGLGGGSAGGQAPQPPEEKEGGTPPPKAWVGEGWTPPLDLLRERRHDLQLEPISGLLVQRPVLVRRGLQWGGLLVGVGIGVCGLLLVWHQMLKARMGQLERYEADVEQLGKTLIGHRAALKKVKGANDQLVKRLSDVRSSSALLADLQLRVPEGVQLTSVRMRGTDALTLEGVAKDPMAFGRVNAMELVLRSSPLIAAKGVKLGRVERQPPREVTLKGPSGAAQPGNKEIKLEIPSAVSFEMSATLTPLAAERLVAVMEGLKADGMVRRLELLQREGLLK